MITDHFLPCGHCWIFQICWNIECSTLFIYFFDFCFYFYFFFKFYFYFILLYNTVLVLPYIDMNLPRVYMSPQQHHLLGFEIAQLEFCHLLAFSGSHNVIWELCVCVVVRGRRFIDNKSVCMSVKLLQSCPTLCDSMDHSPLGSSVHGILQARILESVAVSSFKGIFLIQGLNLHLLHLLHLQVASLPLASLWKPQQE